MTRIFRHTRVVILLLLSGCTSTDTPRVQHVPTIGISWYYPNNDYQRWIQSADQSWRFVELYSLKYEDLDSVLRELDGIILSGGTDIDPKYYDGIDSANLCGRIDPRRDSIETRAFGHALSNNVPVLGVCRGMQVMNVVMGGDMYLDIPVQLGSHIHQRTDTDAVHMVYINNDSLRRIFGIDSGLTNSNHHQAVKNIGTHLLASARTKDGIVEALVYSKSKHPFLLGVQWHPERMDPQSPLSYSILTQFLKAATNHRDARH